MSDEIDPLFQVHRLNEAGIAKATGLAAEFSDLLRYIERVSGASTGSAGTPYPPSLPGGRDLAIARTKLQEAAFFAKRAMAMDPENQE